MDVPFEPNAILRGAQLTVVGAHRALQNPNLFTSDHYRQAAIAVFSGLAIRILVAIPTLLVRALISLLGFIVNLEGATWDNDLVDGLEFIEHSVLQVPFFLMSLMRYITPTLDNLFMESLDWVDRTYIAKHKSEDPQGLRAMYYPNLKMYGSQPQRQPTQKKPVEAILILLKRSGKRAAISLGVYLLSFVPLIGRFVLPAASFYTFRKAVGIQPAVVLFASGIILPKRYLVMFLQNYFSSRTLMRELLVPYFHRIPFDKTQKKRWFHDRSGVLFGFALTFVTFLKIPLVGVLIYGIAEASTAYLITKITEPPPPPTDVEVKQWTEQETKWQNKHEFLSVPLDRLDRLNARETEKKPEKFVKEYPVKRFS